MLIRNSLWNVTGSALPAVAALASVPLLIGALGTEGYGIVTLVSSIVGYFAVLDVNLSAGAIKYLAENHAAGDQRRFAETFWFGAMFYTGLGIVGGGIIYLAGGWIISTIFDLTGAARGPTLAALHVGAIGFALAQLQSYLLVVPQSIQRYDLSAQTEALFGVLVNVATVTAALAGGGVSWVVGARVMVIGANVLYLAILIRSLKLAITPSWPRRDVRRGITHFSAYAYLSKLASTLHQHGDKLIVGALAGPVALTFYTVPATLASRILGLTYRLSSVIYPMASALAASQRMHELRPIYLGATRYISYINLVVLGVVVLAGDEFLRHWVGEQFVESGYPVLVLMTVALLVDSLTNIPSLVNDALGHPDVTGRFALARGVAGVGLVWLGAQAAGIVGAAAAHLLTAIVMSAAFLLYVHGRTVPIELGDLLQQGLARSMGVGLLVFGILFPLKWLIPQGLLGTVLIVSTALLTLALAGLTFIVSVDERAALLAVARRLRG
jgi:O-antigen/teichoic acid export membrane protein